jgi:hypothetical protein
MGRFRKYGRRGYSGGGGSAGGLGLGEKSGGYGYFIVE